MGLNPVGSCENHSMVKKRWWQRTVGPFSISGFLYFCFLQLRGKELIVGGSCHACGRCCHRISLHDGSRWLRRKEDFARLVAEQPEFGRFTVIDTDKEGFLVFSCSVVTENGQCGDYQERLPLCRKFPEKTLPFCGGKLPAGCGYYFREVVPFRKILQQKLEGRHGYP